MKYNIVKTLIILAMERQEEEFLGFLSEENPLWIKREPLSHLQPLSRFSKNKSYSSNMIYTGQHFKRLKSTPRKKVLGKCGVTFVSLWSDEIKPI